MSVARRSGLSSQVSEVALRARCGLGLLSVAGKAMQLASRPEAAERCPRADVDDIKSLGWQL